MDIACNIVANAVALVSPDACAAAYAAIEAAHIQANAARFAGRLSVAAGAFALLAAALGFWGVWWQTDQQRQLGQTRRDDLRSDEQAAIKAAFIAEIDALEAIIEYRGIVRLCQATLQAYERGCDPPLPVFKFNNDGMVVWPVFMALVSRVGSLPAAQASAVTRYYGSIRSIRASWASVEAGHTWRWSREDKANLLRSDLGLYAHAQAARRQLDAVT